MQPIKYLHWTTPWHVSPAEESAADDATIDLGTVVCQSICYFYEERRLLMRMEQSFHSSKELYLSMAASTLFW
jgi:hypothetical protein